MSLFQHLPPVFLARQEEGTVLESYLQVFQDESDLIVEEAQYLAKGLSISTADVTQLSVAYKGFLPTSLQNTQIKVRNGQKHQFTRVNSIRDFMRAKSPDMNNQELHTPRVYYLDIDSNQIYIRQHEGLIYVDLYKNDLVYETIEVSVIKHQIWNDFDELGILYNLPRLKFEDNQSYKKRLLDVRRLLSNGNRVGLLFALHRRLGWVYEMQWDEPTTDITLPHPLVVEESIRVNGEHLQLSVEEIDGYTTIHGIDVEEPVRIRYYAGARFAEAKDFTLEQIEQIHKQAPTLWEHKPWGFGFWPEDGDEKGMDVLPSRGDLW